MTSPKARRESDYSKFTVPIAIICQQ